MLTQLGIIFFFTCTASAIMSGAGRQILRKTVRLPVVRQASLLSGSRVPAVQCSSSCVWFAEVIRLLKVFGTAGFAT